MGQCLCPKHRPTPSPLRGGPGWGGSHARTRRSLRLLREARIGPTFIPLLPTSDSPPANPPPCRRPRGHLHHIASCDGPAARGGTSWSGSMNKALVVILAAVMLDAVGIGLIFPILPALLREVGHTSDISMILGLMLALYSACQFLFSPILGVLSDRFGRRPVLLVSLAGAAIDYIVMAFAPELWLLVIGRAIAGVTSANMAVATAYITDISSEDERARRFGLFHAMFGIGFIIGPVLGGMLGDLW